MTSNLPGNVVYVWDLRWVIGTKGKSVTPGHAGSFGHEHNIPDAPHSVSVFIPRQESWLTQIAASSRELLEPISWHSRYIVSETTALISRVKKCSPATIWHKPKRKTQSTVFSFLYGGWKKAITHSHSKNMDFTYSRFTNGGIPFWSCLANVMQTLPMSCPVLVRLVDQNKTTAILFRNIWNTQAWKCYQQNTGENSLC